VLEDMAIDTSRGISVASVANEIDRAKNKGVGPKTFAEQAQALDPPARKIARAAYPKYQNALTRSNAMDFGDLLLLAVELFAHHPEVRRRWSDRFRYVLVDEFQDTNAIQYDLLKHLVSEHQNLGVVGDDDQSIYRWRGAEVSNILDFTKQFPQAEVVKLEENYRSSANILDAANAVIARNTRRHPKRLRTQAGPGEPIGIALFNHGEEEARMIAELIRQRIDAGGKAEEYAILYRTNAQSRAFEETLKRERVPFTLIGGTGFYERMEVKDIIAYLRLTANPASVQDFERIVNTPARGIGAKSVEKLRRAAERASVSGAQVLSVSKEILLDVGLGKAALEKLRELERLLVDFRSFAETSRAADVAHVIIDRIDYEQHLRDTEPQNADDRIANVRELVSSIAEFEARATIEEGRTALDVFLEQAALSSPDDQNTEEGSVSLLTLHSAKGLEFPVVFMVGMEDQTFPSKKVIESEDTHAMEEERRLCYVGMTRAMRELYLSAARLRRVYGTEEVRRASRFLGELPNEIVGNMPLPRMRIEGVRRVDRGGDAVVYEDEERVSDMAAPSDGFRPGARIHHNTFGFGTIEEREGTGKRTLLRIRFPGEPHLKTVAARFVSLAEDS
jgi:DNA helicase-2/ATP-dependent DNA helicase PcrA